MVASRMTVAKDQIDWNPHAPPPPGVQIDNLRRRGVDLLRFHLHAPHCTGRVFRTLMNVAVVPIIVYCIYANWIIPMLVVLFCMAIIAGQLEPKKIDGNWTISLTPKQLAVSRNKAAGESDVEKKFDIAQIKSIEIKRSRTTSQQILSVSLANETAQLGGGLSQEALIWLKNHLIMEVSGRAWRPLYGVDRSVSRTNKVVSAANTTVLGQDLAARLIEIYQEEAPQFIQQLGVAVDEGDAAGIRQNAHWLKSASAHIGSMHMSEMCQVMQIYGMDNDLARTAILFKEIERTNDDLLRWLNDVSDVFTAAMTHQPPLPVSEAMQGRTNESATVESPADISASTPPAEMKILVIDDSTVSREIARNFLEDLASNLVFADDGQAAIDLCLKEKFDLILTDCEMFGMDGYEFVKSFRAIEASENAEHTPVVALTAHALKGDRARCLEAGMDDYLSKPYTVEELHEKIQTWINPKTASFYDAPIKLPALAQVG